MKEVWGAGQQQVRNIWTNVAVYQLNLWMHTLVELWAWNRPPETFAIAATRRGTTPTTAFARQPSQSLTRTDHRQRIIDHHHRLAATAKNH